MVGVAHQVVESGAGEEVAPQRDLLLLSDIHLGHDLKREEIRRRGGFESLLAADGLDRQLCAFLEHYAQRRSEGGWRLVLAGDVVDFIGICLTPKDLGEKAPFSLVAEEEEFGLEQGPARCAWMMRVVARRHAPFFRRLAWFLSRGHELVVIRGNHDAAFFWTEVQQAFRGCLVDAAREEGLEPEVISAMGDQVRFEPWFYLEPGRIFVEHGHLHDEYCADPDPRVVKADRPDRLQHPISALLLRYFCNRFPTLDHDADDWTWKQYVRWFWVTEKPLVVLLTFVKALAMVLLPTFRRGLRKARRIRRRWSALRASVAAEVWNEEPSPEAYSSRFLPGRAEAERLVTAMGRLVYRSARLGAHGLTRMFHLDRAAVVAASMILAGGCVAMDAPWEFKGVAAMGLLVPALLVERRIARTRRFNSAPKLLEAAEELARVANVPLVVMGHSHRPVDRVLGDCRTRYVNLGAWIGAMHGSSEAGFPHLVVRGISAEFRRWTSSGVHVR